MGRFTIIDEVRSGLEKEVSKSDWHIPVRLLAVPLGTDGILGLKHNAHTVSVRGFSSDHVSASFVEGSYALHCLVVDTDYQNEYFLYLLDGNDVRVAMSHQCVFHYGYRGDTPSTVLVHGSSLDRRTRRTPRGIARHEVEGRREDADHLPNLSPPLQLREG